MTVEVPAAPTDEPASPGEDAPPTTLVRNCTPDRLRLRTAGGRSLVFAPLQQRELRLDPEWRLGPLVDQEVLALAQPRGRKRFAGLLDALIGTLPTALFLGFIAAVVLNGWMGQWALIGFGAFALIALVVAALVAIWGSGAVARFAAQLAMLVLVVGLSVGIPAAVVWRYGHADVVSGSLAELARMLQVVFISLACMVPGLLFFLFDRQRVSTLRARFEQQIFRLDPNVTTLADVEARYGRQIDETYGQIGGAADARLTRQGRWPIPLATIALAFGWILTLLPVGGAPEPATLKDVALSFAPQPNAVAFGFLGAYFFAINLIIRRYARDDLRSKAYSTITVRVLIAVLLGWLVNTVLPDLGGLLLVMAFLIGIVPETFLTFVQEYYRVGRFTKDVEEPVPLKALEGLDLYDRARLLDEGVANIEALANHDLIDLLLETRIPVARLVDWMDQAVLYLHTTAASDLGEGLRKLGIRTATDLETLYQNGSQDTTIRALGRAVHGTADGMADEMADALQVLLTSLRDDEWMGYIRNWRRDGVIYERVIELGQTGEVVDDDRTRIGGDGGGGGGATEPAAAPRAAATLRAAQ